jgi:hypothetical protein
MKSKVLNKTSHKKYIFMFNGSKIQRTIDKLLFINIKIP